MVYAGLFQVSIHLTIAVGGLSDVVNRTRGGRDGIRPQFINDYKITILYFLSRS